MILNKRQWCNDKLLQMYRLMNYLPFCENQEQKRQIEDEIKNIQHLIDNVKHVYVLELTVESKMNYLNEYDYAEKME